MPESYHIRIAKERLVFSAAHFITYDDDVCEPLHGHNYHVTAEVHGPLNENQYVVDFIAVRDALQVIVDSLDHHVLLPTEHPTIHVAEVESESTDEAASAAGRPT
jgi:6-pyruvoyltetrahydropterin/6-carboxytetrahydropterin synthase